VFTGIESPSHILMLLLVAFLLFGAKRLPEIGRSLGHGLREFKESVSGEAPTEPAQQLSEEPRQQIQAEEPIAVVSVTEHDLT